jgi:hypothetical protein
MPRVPFKPAELTPIGEAGAVPVPIDNFGLPGKAAGAAFNTLGEAGVKAGILARKYQEKLDEARAETEKVAVETEMYKDGSAFLDNIRKRSDWKNFIPDLEKAIQDNTGKYQGMVSNPHTFTKMQSKISHYWNATMRDAVQSDVWKRDMNEQKAVYFGQGGAVDMLSNYYEKTGDVMWTDELRDDLNGAIARGLIDWHEAEKAYNEATIGGDVKRMKNTIDADPAGWISKYGNVEKSMPELKKQFPFLADREEEIRKQNVYAFAENRRQREERHQAIKDMQEHNEAVFMQKWLNQSASGKPITGALMRQWEKEAGYDPSKGPEGDTLDNPFVRYIQSALQARINHIETLGRVEPKMNERAWISYGALIDKIDNNQAKYANIAKYAGTFPSSIMGGLMHHYQNSNKQDQKVLTDYINQQKKLFTPEALAELKGDVINMTLSPEYKDHPDKWLPMTKEMAARKFKEQGGLAGRLGELNGPGGGPVSKPSAPPSAPPKGETAKAGTRKKIGDKWYRNVGPNRWVEE